MYAKVSHKHDNFYIPVSAEGLGLETLKSVDANISGLYFENASSEKVEVALKGGHFVAPEGGWEGKQFFTMWHAPKFMENKQLEMMLPMVKKERAALEATVADVFQVVKHHGSRLKNAIFMQNTYPVLADPDLYDQFMYSIKLGKALEDK